MSSGEEFEVGEILEQRKRKGVLQYLVRWQGFNELYDSWEPAVSLGDCAAALKAFVAKTKKAKSKSRSRSRGRTTKSRSRSSSRGRTKQSRSRSTGRKTTKSSVKVVAEVVGKAEEEEASSVQTERVSRLRSRVKAAEQVATTTTTSESLAVSLKQSVQSERTVAVEKVEVVKNSVETVQSTPTQSTESTTTMTTRSRLAVRQVENDENLASRASPPSDAAKDTWVWYMADHAVLIIFIIVSIIALSFTLECTSGVRDKLVPDLTVLRQRLLESYEHFVQGLNYGYSNLANTLTPAWNNLKDALLLGGGGGEGAKSPPAPAKTAA